MYCLVNKGQTSVKSNNVKKRVRRSVHCSVLWLHFKQFYRLIFGTVFICPLSDPWLRPTCMGMGDAAWDIGDLGSRIGPELSLICCTPSAPIIK
jgi:hypothetical protein